MAMLISGLAGDVADFLGIAADPLLHLHASATGLRTGSKEFLGGTHASGAHALMPRPSAPSNGRWEWVRSQTTASRGTTAARLAQWAPRPLLPILDNLLSFIAPADLKREEWKRFRAP